MSVKPSTRSNSSLTYCGARQIAGIFAMRMVVVSSAPSAASDLAQAPNPPRPAAPANAALVRNRRRLWIGTEHLPDPDGWITRLLAGGRFAQSGSRRRPRGVVPRIADHNMPVKVRGRASSTLTEPQRRGMITELSNVEQGGVCH